MARCNELCTQETTGTCACCEALAERDRFEQRWFKGGLLIDGIRVLKQWWSPVSRGPRHTSVKFKCVCKEELKYITVRRGGTVAEAESLFARNNTALSTKEKKSKKAIEETLIGLALSGGGIRSATTCLGILQALTNMNLLKHVDYLCTVSGGGYIGGCLSALLSVRNTSQRPVSPPAWEFHQGDHAQFNTHDHFPFSEAATTAPTASASTPELSGKEQVKYLRTHGNFLIARKGMFGTEAMRSVGTLFTGVLSNIILFLITLLTIAGLYMASLKALAPSIYTELTPDATHRLSADPEASKRTQTIRSEFPVTTDALGRTTRETIETVKEPLTFVGYVWEYAKILWNKLFALWSTWPLSPAVRPFVLAALVSVIAVLLLFGVVWKEIHVRRPASQSARSHANEGQSEEDAFESMVLGVTACVVVSCTVVVTATLRIYIADAIPAKHQLAWLFLPLVFCIFGLATSTLVYLSLGFGETIAVRCRKSYRRFAEVCSELWTRTFRSVWGSVQAVWLYLVLVCLAFAFLSTVVFALRASGIWPSLSAVVAFVATRLLIRRIPVPAGKMRIPPGLRNFLLGGAVTLFLVSTLTTLCVLLLSIGPRPGPSLSTLLGISGAAFAVFVLMGYCVNANRIGLHYFYRDRLIETFLRTEVKDERKRMQLVHDAMEIRLVDLHGVPSNSQTPSGAQGLARWLWEGSRAPYHLISAAINMADRRDLTRKDRKSGYFLFSKLFCGSEETGFQPTDVYRGGETKLSRAITISGAAVSSAMGYHTFFAQAFATALFNLRTGYWMENPGLAGARRKIVFWPWYLWKEILSATSARGAMVNLSDGGHTGDNVGIYPLLQRRCKIIIACDAEQNANLSFGSFTEALRHAYIDENIDVDIDLEMLRPDDKTGFSRNHCAIGRIRYPDRPEQKSWLIYIKNSLTGDEPEPVTNYKRDYPEFPHQTTGDQFFDDAQFESYRALGVHLAEHTFGEWKALDARNDRGEQLTDDDWLELQLLHSPFTAQGADVFQKLSDSYNALERMFVGSDTLAGYYGECYGVSSSDAAHDGDPVKIRQAFMMQATLMEQVFFGLQLDRYANAPDARGWINLFRRWARSPRFQQEFTDAEELFSSRLVDFYHNYIKGRRRLEDNDWVRHPWDPAEEGRPNAHGIFLDPGRIEAGLRRSSGTQITHYGCVNLLSTGRSGVRSREEEPSADHNQD
jgi:hypothetical protein